MTGVVEFDLPAFPASDPPVEGDRAPDFTRPLVRKEYWDDVAFSEFAADAGAALLVFYPLNWGGKSMYWWKEIEKRGWGGDGVGVVGVGISQPFDHQRFIESRDLPYPLYSDPGNGVAQRYDVVHDLGGMAGIAEPRPSVFLVDENLTVEYVWVADVWPESPPYDAIEAELDRS